MCTLFQSSNACLLMDIPANGFTAAVILQHQGTILSPPSVPERPAVISALLTGHILPLLSFEMGVTARLFAPSRGGRAASGARELRPPRGPAAPPARRHLVCGLRGKSGAGPAQPGHGHRHRHWARPRASPPPPGHRHRAPAPGTAAAPPAASPPGTAQPWPQDVPLRRPPMCCSSTGGAEAVCVTLPEGKQTNENGIHK